MNDVTEVNTPPWIRKNTFTVFEVDVEFDSPKLRARTATSVSIIIVRLCVLGYGDGAIYTQYSEGAASYTVGINEVGNWLLKYFKLNLNLIPFM